MREIGTEIYEFGSFRLDVSEHSLTRLDSAMDGRLPEKAFKTLCVLVRWSGRLISKNELIEQVWPDTFVEENNLDKCIYQIRCVLRESPGEEKYVETVRKHGYRFVADVRRVRSDGSVVDPIDRIDEQPAATAAIRAVRSGKAESGRQWPALFAVAAIAVTTLLLSIAYFGSGLVTPAVRAGRGTPNDEAYRFYLNGVNLLGRSSLPTAQESIENLEESSRLDPRFAAAHAALARGRIEISSLVEDPAQECAKAGSSVDRALELDPSLAQAHESAALLKYKCEWNFAAAEPEFVRAIALDPNSDSAHASYASYLSSVGRSDRARAEIERAIEINPNSADYRIQHGMILLFGKRYVESIAAFQRSDQLAPLGLAHGWVWTACVLNGDEDRAFEWFIKYETERKQIKREPERIQMLRTLYASTGWKGIREMQLNTEAQNPVYAMGKYFRLARLSTLLGRSDDAFEYLERAFDRRDSQLLLLKYEPIFEPLHTDPRYADLIRRIGFPADG